jgi:hypothetical protein
VNVRRSTVRLATACVVGAGLLVACGSKVPPEVFLQAQGGLGTSTNLAPGVNGASPAGVPNEAGAAAPTLAGGRPAAPARPTSHLGGGAGGTSAVPAAGTTSSAGSRAGGRGGQVGGSPARTASVTQPAPSSRPAPAACTRPTAAEPTVVVCPSTGLQDGQSVHVYASGFQNAKRTGLMPAALVVTECADKGNNTQQADCGELHFVNPDSNGRVSITITVTKVVGSNKNVCGEKYRCLVSVAQPKQPPDYEADQYISFV